jgi:hypothetical protein
MWERNAGKSGISKIRLQGVSALLPAEQPVLIQRETETGRPTHGCLGVQRAAEQNGAKGKPGGSHSTGLNEVTAREMAVIRGINCLCHNSDAEKLPAGNRLRLDRNGDHFAASVAFMHVVSVCLH